jgi:hypothetical protein
MDSSLGTNDRKGVQSSFLMRSVLSGASGCLAVAVCAWSTPAWAAPAMEAPAMQMVDASADNLLALDGSVSPSDLTYAGIVEFLTCFASNMDLPAQVYLDCGLAVARASRQCNAEGLNPQCLSSLVSVAQKCAAPVSKAIQSVQLCLASDQEGRELLPLME